MPVDYNSLRTLLNLQSPSNLSPGNDPWLASRRPDIYSGLDEWLPDANSEMFRATQDDGMTTDQFGVRHQASVRPRAGMRNDAMALLKQKLGMGAIESGRSLNSELQKIALKGNIEGRSQERQAEIYADRARLQSELADERNANAAARAFDRTQYTQGNINDRAAASLEARGTKSTPPTQGQTKALNDARAGYQGGMSRLQRTLGIGNGGRDAYLNALNDVLVRSGSSVFTDAQEAKKRGMSLADVTAFAQSQGIQYNPYEQEYLQLTLGQ